MKNYLSQKEIPVGSPLEGIGPLGKPGTNAPTLFSNFLSGVVGLLTTIAAIWFLFQFMIGTIGIISAGGDKAKIEKARSQITSAIIGLVVAVAAIFIADLVGSLIGIDVLNPIELLERVRF